ATPGATDLPVRPGGAGGVDRGVQPHGGPGGVARPLGRRRALTGRRGAAHRRRALALGRRGAVGSCRVVAGTRPRTPRATRPALTSASEGRAEGEEAGQSGTARADEPER